METYRRLRADQAALVVAAWDDLLDTNTALTVRAVTELTPIVAVARDHGSVRAAAITYFRNERGGPRAALHTASMSDTSDDTRERLSTLAGLEEWLERPMLALGLVWLALLVVELTHGLPRVLEVLGTGIWVAFIADFALRLAIAPRKGAYLRDNWLTALSLLLPALRVFRALRVVRIVRAARAGRVLAGATRGARLVRVVGSLNRTMHALGRAFSRRGFGYVVLLTVLITLGGAAGMYAFERPASGGRGIHSYGEALWWTAMLMTTMGSEYWPRTAEGRTLCVLLSLYAFAVFGYVTATLATYFLGRDAANPDAEVAGEADMTAIRTELAALRRELAERTANVRASPD